MLACSNEHISREYTISGVALSTTFRVSPWFVTSIKGVQGVGFLSHWLVLNFRWMYMTEICMAGHWRMLLELGFSDCS